MENYSNKSIFKYIKEENNNKLSEIKGYDLQELLELLNNYRIDLRETLNIDENISFGLELEFELALRKLLNLLLKKHFQSEKWKTKIDRSLLFGGEISTPILKDTKETWQELDEVCRILKKLSKISGRAGGHIHVGTQVLGTKKESWVNFLKIWTAYENIIFRFSAGEYSISRHGTIQYAKPVSEYIFNKLEEDETIELLPLITELSKDRYQAVNFKKITLASYEKFCENNTIEFRCPNATLNSVIWQNNVNFFVKLLEYSKSTNFNKDLVEQKYQSISKNKLQVNLYNEIYLSEALELADMIFNNNLDKINFLKQYIKSWEPTRKFQKVKMITK